MTDVRNIHNNGNVTQAVSTSVSTNDNDYRVKLNIVAQQVQTVTIQGSMNTPHIEQSEPTFVQNLRQNRLSRSYFLRKIVDEYCGIYYLQNEFRVNVNDLSLIDKKIFLSHVVDAWEYEEYCSSVSKLYAGFLDNLKYMQRLLDETSDEFYQDYLADMGCCNSLEHEYGISR